MQILTLVQQLDYAGDFDCAVNEALGEGWQLIRREVINPGTEDKHIMLYAELMMPD